MNLLSYIIPGTTATGHDTNDLYELLVAVLPTFSQVAQRAHDLCEPANPQDNNSKQEFYLSFLAKTFNLYAVLERCNPVEVARGRPKDEADVQRILYQVLDELENRFLSQQRFQSAFELLGLERHSDAKIYPKLVALKRRLPEADVLDEEFLTAISLIIRIDSRNPKKRGNLLLKLDQALKLIYKLVLPSMDSDSECPERFLDYPLRHVWTLTKTLFESIQTNWCCQCSHSSLHVSRKTRLSLTQHQQFEITPARGEIISKRKARFRLLFPVSSQDLKWQHTEVAVVSEYREDIDGTEAERGLCKIIQGARKGTYPRILISGQKLWQLRTEIERNQKLLPQAEDNKFRSLRDLFQPTQRHSESSMALTKAEDRLVLSFILATFLLHSYGGPWLRENFNSENICFYTSRHRLPDITTPYFTATCSPNQDVLPVNLDQPHRFPDLLSLGIILLEIAQGFPVQVEESQDRCLVALQHMDKWEDDCQRGGFKVIPDGLRQAISACLDPSKFKKHRLDKKNIDDFHVRKYIFDRILYPLGDALRTTYEIQLHTLPSSTGAKVASSLDHCDENGPEKGKEGEEWWQHLEHVHDLFYECENRYENIKGKRGGLKEEARVKIAVLDTGLALGEAYYENFVDARRINPHQSEDFVSMSERKTTPGWMDDCYGHGSQVGRIILDIAPGAVLHVAKVFETMDDLKNPRKATQIHGRIAMAIDRATNEWKVDIIIMCFGFDEPIPLIQKAINEAYKSVKPPLFFAATRNDAAHRPMAWPANERRVIGISATDVNGVASKFNPLEGDSDSTLYAFGEGVKVDVVDRERPGHYITKYVSGTSYATAVAVGLASNLLACIRMLIYTASENDRETYGHLPEQLQRMDGMLAVLKRRMQSEHLSGQKSLLPWRFLDPRMVADNKILRDVDDTLRMRD
ncbi:hypothetical protein G7054_g13928 [Neopestalotiopsis clavispora]|nr:hypothetical protein G7054_g13928 [Neopestalotiopsis clavispora]